MSQTTAPSLAQSLVDELGVSPIIAHILIRRGFSRVDDAARFLGLLSSEKVDPMKFHGVPETVEKILHHIDRGSTIVVYGDYDVDGITGGSLYQEYLARHTDKVSYFIPDRIEDGYGLSCDALRRLKEQNVDLVLTVDNGISCWVEAELAKELGIDLIITDHHELPPRLPDCTLVNTKINHEAPELAGVGIAFIVCYAIEKVRPTTGVNDLLDLFAVGTIADVAPLVGLNRILVRAGLKIASKKKRPGLKALIEQNDIFIGGRHELQSSHIGFKIGPCLNAAGRIDRADAGVKLLTTKDPEEAATMASHLLEINEKRKDLTAEVHQNVESFIADRKLDTTKAIVYYDHGNHHGVLGIVASRVVEKYGVPALILGYNVKGGQKMYSGSCRAPAGFNLFDAIQVVKEKGLIVGGGGHAVAAGVSVAIDKIEEFSEAVNEALFEGYDPDAPSGGPSLDADVMLGSVNDDFMTELGYFQPTGQGNPEITLMSQDVRIKEVKPFKGGSGFSLVVTEGMREFRCVAFKSLMHELPRLKEGLLIDISYTPEYNFFPPGRPASIQLRLKKIY